MSPNDTRLPEKLIAAAGIVTAGAMLAASFLPTTRVWGLTEWAYLPVWVRVALALGVAIAYLLLLRRGVTLEACTGEDDEGGAITWPLILGVTILAGTIFYAFRTQVHFLGDGYLLLNSLASDNPLLRSRNFGEMLIHIWIKDALPLAPKEAALAAFRIVSIGAGMLHAALVLYVAPRIAGERRLGWLFAIAMLSGGYALLYFGYVENYSLFGLSVAVFVYTGIMIQMGRLSRFWAVPSFGLTVFFHALGLSLAPAVMYLLISRTALTARWSSMARAARWSLTALGSIGLAILAYYVVAGSTFLEYSLVPFGGSFRVLEGYTMFSGPHFADLANLILLLVPGFLVLVAAVITSRQSEIRQDPRIRFAALTALAVTSAAFVFEAKLGMPRDWDLFSYIGIPWLALLLLAVTISVRRQLAERVILAAIIIGCASLAPRVITANTPTKGIQQFRDYAEIDIRKNRSGWYVLGQYYLSPADTDSASAIAVRALRDRRFPEESLNELAKIAFEARRIDSALTVSRRAVSLNPTFAGSWSTLGACYTAMNMADSAIWALERANGLNPDVAVQESALGLAFILAGRYEEAERWFLRAHRSDTALFEPMMSLARVYQRQGRDEEYLRWLHKAVFRHKSDGIWATELGDAYLRRGEFRQAAMAYSEALRKGADSLKILGLVKSTPQLAPFMSESQR